ncbi:Uu.00g026720.m01.CDS01 [Anthostomella pinea]|uniref:Uu.00g026720.m01.CDS01 n=1 Tax=Anthostomella pinea TaxID=933095 RepID=A0AAI8V7J8_9PEZI|nr:Uu.00g026720.m01.CDS01 [Anthostomella pinea]
MSHDDPKRREIIVKRANWAGGHLNNQETSNPSSTPLPDVQGQGSVQNRRERYAIFSHSSLHELFDQIKEQWDGSQDARDLKATFEQLIADKRLPKIDKIVCFGLGYLIFDEINNDRDTASQEETARRCSQHAAAMAIASVLESRPDNGGPVRLYTQDDDYRVEDTIMLRRLGFEMLNPGYGFQEGFVKVDENTLILAMGSGYGVQKVVCETSRPAAIIWAFPMGRDLASWWEFLGTRRTLAMEYDHHNCAALEHEWEKGYEAELIPRQQSPYFGKPIPGSRLEGMSDAEKKEFEGLVNHPWRPPLRRSRFLRGSSLYVKKTGYNQ